MHGFAELRRIVRRDEIALRVEQIAFPITLEDFAKHPAVAVEVCKLRITKQSIQASWHSAVSQKFKVRPHAAQACSLGIAIELFLLFVLARIVLLRGIHLRAVALVVPPRETEIRRDHVCAWMHMTDHALRRGNSGRELMEDRVARFTSRN